MCGRRSCISIQQADLTKPDGKFAIFRQAMCAARSCISIQQARLTMHGGKFLPAGFADAGDLALVRQLTEADTADAVVAQVGVGTAADLAAVILAGGVLRLSLIHI